MIDFPQFIYGEIVDHNVCDQIVDWFETLPDDKMLPGVVGNHLEIKKHVKESSDTLLSYNEELLSAYQEQLRIVCTNYQIKYPGCTDRHHPWFDTTLPNVQRYHPGGGFKKYHSENSGFPEERTRHLTYMTYLNDVPDGGTHFMYQDFYCPAVKGLTIIWPAPWTFMHKGVVSQTKTKYIVTGWYNFYDEESKD